MVSKLRHPIWPCQDEEDDCYQRVFEKGHCVGKVDLNDGIEKFYGLLAVQAATECRFGIIPSKSEWSHFFIPWQFYKLMKKKELDYASLSRNSIENKVRLDVNSTVKLRIYWVVATCWSSVKGL